MVCPRCIRTVEKILGKLSIGYRSIILGQVELERELADKEREALRKELADEGFELIDDIQSTKVEAIRLAIIQWARMSGERYAKELISYGDKSISEIAWELGFSSPAHFSAQFKKESGISPKEFKALRDKNRTAIDQI